ncbi:AbrB/MazE/SpoVT family DNA-binding domain-containing protein [Methylosinus sporium]|uniref:AbrB/MazE/SpoVT family DNA-binding domain-containing protein n=1 Tax=Methylosinus sporium TaxID=428 RepID=UPI00383A23CA
MRAGEAETRRSVYATLGADHRITLPRALREYLRLQPGDSLRFVIDDEGVSLERVAHMDRDCFSTFTEWASADDHEAYSNL